MGIKATVDKINKTTRKMTTRRYTNLIEHALTINHLLITIVVNTTKKITKIIIMTIQTNMA